jgi:hypothetical protein
MPRWHITAKGIQQDVKGILSPTEPVQPEPFGRKSVLKKMMESSRDAASLPQPRQTPRRMYTGN